jgi:energy-coupling factor transport system substrate-specific component
VDRIAATAVYGVTTAVGLVAFFYPFWLPAVEQRGLSGMAHAGDAALVLTLLVVLAFAVLLLEVQRAALSAKMVALLGVLVAINSVLRFVDVAIPGPGGFSPIFVLIILGGYVYGPRVGFLIGVLTLLVSALITGGMGPWLPYQMFAAGWAGLSAVAVRLPVRWLGGRAEVAWLALFGGVWGLLFGALMNIWFWPYVAGSADQYWTPGIAVWETLRRYALFYVATSLVWDIMRSVGNVTLILAFGPAILKVLRRFHQRFLFTHVPALARPAAQEAPRGVYGATAPATLESRS